MIYALWEDLFLCLEKIILGSGSFHNKLVMIVFTRNMQEDDHQTFEIFIIGDDHRTFVILPAVIGDDLCSLGRFVSVPGKDHFRFGIISQQIGDDCFHIVISPR